jgi:selenocysteine lyase/cysteine desulfurase
VSVTYLDNAATTFPKPRSVSTEVTRCIRYYCGNPGRSSHALAKASAGKIYECRERTAAYFGSEAPESVVFTMNATHALNTAIKGILRRGDHVLISDMEHNAVYRPIEKLSRENFISYDVFSTVKDGVPLPDGEIIRSIKRLIKPSRTRMLICSHVPNICSAVRPIAQIGELCRQKNILFVLDAAQSAGHLPIDVGKSCVDILCAPAHKGLFGIQGCGFMLISGENIPRPVVEGGNGVDSLEWKMPELLPERLEAGTMPTPAIAALSEGIGFISQIDQREILLHERKLFARARDMILNSPELSARIYMPESEGAVLLFSLDDIPSETVGRYLADKGICVRSGFHCSALGHKALGTPESGAVRASFSIFNGIRDVDTLLDGLKSCVADIK